MCDLFEATFPGVKCRPEPITDGGVQLIHWPGKQTQEEYKSFRFLSSQGYPWIDEGTRDDASFFLSNRGKVVIKLKAFYNAPPFSDAELRAFRHIFEQTVSLPDGWRFKVLPKRLDTFL